MIDRSNLQPLVNVPKGKKPKKRMRALSSKRGQLNHKYRMLKREFLKQHPICQHWLAENGWEEVHGLAGLTYRKGDMIPVSAHVMESYFHAPRSSEIHHKKGRYSFFLDTTTWMAVRPGHDVYIHQDPKRYEKGYCLPRR